MHRIRVKLKRTCDDSYDIFVGNGILDRLNTIGKILDDADRCVIVSDSIVGPLYGNRVAQNLSAGGLSVDMIEIPAGEASKAISVVLDVARRLAALKASRKTLLVALGGGVVGDLAGFVASTYMRSIPYVQIATSLIAQVDSSVGGKTGVDIPEGKNLIGTFYQPKAVFIDLSLLKTLPDKDLRNGLAEIIKYAIISDEAIFGVLERDKALVMKRDPGVMKDLISRCCEIKADIVQKDEKEGGLRRILNFGHTLGHALEAGSHYTLTHGEAIAIGMIAAARISCRLGHLKNKSCARIEDLVRNYGLPTRFPAELNTGQILAHMAADKKAVGSRIHFVLIKDIARPFVTGDVPKEMITDVVDALRR
ncbi:MAG: 3-dehydroquinate synthase [Deltaproteobacteria bacterium]|nr:3-dehydroquinate synthase [Deltaproteobacteria bacterium]